MDALRTLKPGGIALFEFFGDPVFYNQGADVFSESEEHGHMYNNAYTAEELPEFILSCGGVMLNHYPWPITPGWGNHWVTFTKGS
jgi:hypothetical protein